MEEAATHSPAICDRPSGGGPIAVITLFGAGYRRVVFLYLLVANRMAAITMGVTSVSITENHEESPALYSSCRFNADSRTKLVDQPIWIAALQRSMRHNEKGSEETPPTAAFLSVTTRLRRSDRSSRSD